MNSKKGSAAKVLVIVLVLVTIYLLCTDYMYITYNGAFTTQSDKSAYTDLSGIIEFNIGKYQNSDIAAGVRLETLTDVDKSEFYCGLSNDESVNGNTAFNIQTSSSGFGDKNETVTESTDNFAVSYSKMNNPINYISPDMGKLCKGDTVKLFVKAEGDDEYVVSGVFTYNTENFKIRNYYNTQAYTTVSYSAFDLLFGSGSKDNMTFGGNLWALFFWLPPLITIGFYVFDRKSNLKHLTGMAMSVVSIFAVVYFVGGARLAFGSMLSIVINLVIFILCLYSALLGLKNRE